MNASSEAEAKIADCFSRLNDFLGTSLGCSKAVIASDVAECSSVALGVLRDGGSEGGKELLGKSVVGFIFC